MKTHCFQKCWPKKLTDFYNAINMKYVYIALGIMLVGPLIILVATIYKLAMTFLQQ